MNVNVVGGALGMAALVAIFVFHNHVPSQAPSIPPVITNPMPTKAPSKPVPPKDPAIVYHRVEQDGKQGPEVACKTVESFADGKTAAELAAVAKQRGVSVDSVKRWLVCNN